ncbi:MAG: reverse transcriptase family protein [Patescibacteria group bacterium]
MLPKLKDIKINSLRELSLRLGIELKVLQDVAEYINIHYEKFSKKMGEKVRMLYEADHSLEEIHRQIEKRILNRFDYPLSLQGGIKGRSRLTNAMPHVKKLNVGHFDIKSFFPSVRPSHVYCTFHKLGGAPDVAHLLTRLVTADNHLPQGFKTSTKVAALVLLDADRRLSHFLKKYGVVHNIWVDNLTVSGSYPIKKLVSGIRRILRQEGFESHKEKFVYSHERQAVLGVVVNVKPNVPKDMRKEVDGIVYKCEKFGVRSYLKVTKQNMRIKQFLRHVNGKLSSMLAVDKEKYRPLYERWQKVIASSGVKV